MFFLTDLLKYLAALWCIFAAGCAGVWAFGVVFEQFLQRLAQG